MLSLNIVCKSSEKSLNYGNLSVIFFIKTRYLSLQFNKRVYLKSSLILGKRSDEGLSN